MRFENQVALVTGAASGIGRALVQQLVAEGAAVVAVDIVEEALHQVVTDLQAQGGKVTGCVANISADPDVERMLGTATSSYGRLDVLCNNAGIMDLMTPAADVPLALWERVLGVNLTGPFLACRRAIPIMLEQGTRSIAFHYGERGIRCNAVCPGGVATAIGAGSGIPHEAGLAKVMAVVQSSAGRPAQPEQIASVIAFLASNEASNVNGAILTADNGWFAA